MLVMTSTMNPMTQEILNRVGMRQIHINSTMDALRQLRRTRFNAIIVDREHASFDVLEFVLNVRDFEPSIPIVILAESLDAVSAQALENQPQTLLLEKWDVSELLGLQENEHLRAMQLS